jgi:signal transduction histidine kinase
VFVDAFNAMLHEIDISTTELEETNRSLQRESETRRRAEMELREADRRKDEFLATLAHELRNPMAPMLNALSMLRTAGQDADISRRGPEILERQLAQLVRLVDDLLDVSRISSGKLTIRKEIVPLSAIVRDAIETVEPQLEARCHKLAVNLPATEVFLSADPSRLAQVLGNLLNNAIKFSVPGSGITVSAVADADTVRIDVTDQGAGIAVDALARVFEMFSQGDTTATEARSGLGVGLALARQLVRLHDGSIEAHSEGPGKGARFTISIPRAEAPADVPAAAQQPGPDPVFGERILIVDDNVDFAGSLAQLFGSIGHDVHVANSGEAALKMAREIAPDVAILDIGLPDMSGHELAGLVRSAVDKPSLVLIAISGWGQETDRQRSLQAGFDLHLVKPVDFRKIQDSIRELRSGAGT